jgi:hypothetical protein
MCMLRRRQLNLKSRGIFAAGNLCLTSGLMLSLVLRMVSAIRIQLSSMACAFP